MLGGGCLAVELTRARPGAPDSRHPGALCGSGRFPSLFHLLSRNGQLRKGEPRTRSVPARKAELCRGASPAPGTLLLSSTSAAFGAISDGSQLVLLLTFKKMACCHLALCQGLLSKPTSSAGTAPRAQSGADWRPRGPWSPSDTSVGFATGTALGERGGGAASFVTDEKGQFYECKHTS